ncbi:exostosin-1 [Brachionus plicatilis]|uniref:Exostosin-1 n=1 Tax=Brachionus plicatilis TaxID=10195 RepID=A0A3M7QGQ2_BRAPC|nr:exostosin-1 [Brachionus plicatilis]
MDQNNDDTKIFKSNKKNFKAKDQPCTLLKCFDIGKCKSEDLKVYIYNFPNITKSPVYKNILSVFKKYATSDPSSACLFVSSIDTLDQDRRSKNFVESASSLLPKLKYWNHGRNHLIFNMYSGTWPDYLETLALKTEQAILIRTSISDKTYRKGFDISFPLISQDFTVFNSKVQQFQVSDSIFRQKKYFLIFKGKRYLHGFGSDVRNKLYLLNNNRDIVLLTTCKHEKNWIKFKDKRCDEDNKNYEKFDYNDLLNNSTFCLIPRGRRLGTYRFLEVLKVGCIAVLLTDNWILPLSELIDWKKAVVFLKEKDLMQVPSILRKIPHEQITQMRKFSLHFYQKYFCSLETIIDSTMDLLDNRIKRYRNYLFNS